MTHFNPEDVDLADVATMLFDTFGSTVDGAVVGRTRFRDAVHAHLGCSQLEAEQLVDTMVSRGLLTKVADAGAPERWQIRMPAT